MGAAAYKQGSRGPGIQSGCNSHYATMYHAKSLLVFAACFVTWTLAYPRQQDGKPKSVVDVKDVLKLNGFEEREDLSNVQALDELKKLGAQIVKTLSSLPKFTKKRETFVNVNWQLDLDEDLQVHNTHITVKTSPKEDNDVDDSNSDDDDVDDDDGDDDNDDDADDSDDDDDDDDDSDADDDDDGDSTEDSNDDDDDDEFDDDDDDDDDEYNYDDDDDDDFYSFSEAKRAGAPKRLKNRGAKKGETISTKSNGVVQPMKTRKHLSRPPIIVDLIEGRTKASGSKKRTQLIAKRSPISKFGGVRIVN